VTVEPRVEDLLATIRKAIDDDLGGLSKNGASTSSSSQGTLMRSSIRELRVSFDVDPASKQQADNEIEALRNRIKTSRVKPSFTAPKVAAAPRPLEALNPAPLRGGISEILNGPNRRLTLTPPAPPPELRQTIVAEDVYAAPEIYEEPAYEDAAWEETQHYAPVQEDYYPPQDYQPQAPQQALVSPQTAYSAQNSFQNLADTILARATSERSIEDMTRDLLRGMLKSWLDDNLPDLVERLVREEIERVARRGR
jgi:uncharacterized protein